MRYISLELIYISERAVMTMTYVRLQTFHYIFSFILCLRLLAQAATAAGWHSAGREFEPQLGRIFS